MPFRNMGIADCELVEEFARQILPKLATRDLKQDITCVPYQQSGSRFLVRGEILRTLPERRAGLARTAQATCTGGASGRHPAAVPSGCLPRRSRCRGRSTSASLKNPNVDQ